MSYKTKVVLVTGGSAGIGEAIAIAFAKEGASVAIVGRNETNLKKVAQTCDQYGGNTLIIKADITKDEEAKTTVESTIDKFGKLDVLVNNAGIVKPGELLKGTALETYDDITRINLRAAVHMTSLAAPHLVKTKGNIVNISSVLGSVTLKHWEFSAYGMSKAALNYFTRTAALELGPHGVRVNAVSPGPTVTDIFNTAGIDTNWDIWAKKTALGKSAASKEVADVVLFIASDKAKSVTGSEYAIDNGARIS